MDAMEEQGEKIILQYLEIKQISKQERKTKPRKQIRRGKMKKKARQKMIKATYKQVIRKKRVKGPSIAAAEGHLAYQG